MIEISNLPLDITNHIIKFRNFLNASWPCLDELMDNHEWDDDGGFIDDWIQCNWEFLVERELLNKQGHLFPLEWNSRITEYRGQRLYQITCTIKKDIELIDWIKKINNYENEKLLLSGFRTKHETSFGLYPPFDYVEIRSKDKKKIYIIPFSSCRFILE